MNCYGIIAAVEAEMAAIKNIMTECETVNHFEKEFIIGKIEGKKCVLSLCGVGKVNASIGTQLLIDKFSVEKILNFGVAGGLNEETKLCQVYQIGQAVQFDFDLTQLNGTKMGTLDEYTENYLPLSTFALDFPVKNLGTSDRFNDRKADYLLLTEELGADIRDMEGCAIVQTALCSAIPVYSVKAISDVAGSGSTTEQFLKNKDKALQNLKAVLPQIFAQL